MTYPHLVLTSNPHDRAALRRTDEAWLDERWADPASRVLVVSGTRVRPVSGALEWVSPNDAPEGTRVLLGQRDDSFWFAVVTGPELAKSEPDAVAPSARPAARAVG